MTKEQLSTEAADDLVASVDTGARNAVGWQGKIIPYTAFVWALFQLYIASPLPFWLKEVTGLNVVVTYSDARNIHLAFAMFLGAMAFPLFKSSPRNRIPWYDWALGGLAVMSCLYLVFFRYDIADRAGLPTTSDLTMSIIGIVVLGFSVYRALGLPLLIIASLFLSYVFFGDAAWLPDLMQWKGASMGKTLWHFWMQEEGVFGQAIFVSATLIFLFVLFGGILEKAGAGNYFTKLAFALLGHLRGGPAKAAVVASAMSGLYSGSSIANTVTTGTFTIPLMKRTGFSAEKAGAVEVASSTNGQLTPPVMGAAAFLIAEFTGIEYTDILLHALVPALVSYIALVYIVHLEAMKLGLQGLPKPPSRFNAMQKLRNFLGGLILTIIAFFTVYKILELVASVAPAMSFATTVAILLFVYVVLVGVAARYPDLKLDDPNDPIDVLPAAGATAITGLYYVLPIVVLIWCILPTPERLSPALAAFWATLAMTFVAITHRPLKSLFRGDGKLGESIGLGIADWCEGMIGGSRNMIGIGIATGAAGIIIGTIGLTGAHQVIGSLIEAASGGSLILMLLLVAVMSLILGMGLPTTANYIVVSSLMAPVIISLGAKSGLIVPVIAVHLFVFYFGILADDTPPVGLAAFAAAAISGGDPIKTGIQGFAYDIRTALLPFLFIFNTELLLIDVTPIKAVFVFIVAVCAMMLFAAATQGFFLVRNKVWESVLMLLVAFTLFRPGYWLDQIDPPFEEQPGASVLEIAENLPAEDQLRLIIRGPDLTDFDKVIETTIVVPSENGETGEARFMANGLMVMVDGDQATLDEPLLGTPFSELSRQMDFYGDEPVTIKQVQTPRDRIMKEVFYLPALLLFAVIFLSQRSRLRKEKLATGAPQVA